MRIINDILTLNIVSVFFSLTWAEKHHFVSEKKIMSESFEGDEKQDFLHFECIQVAFFLW